MNAGDLRHRISLQIFNAAATNENGFPLPEEEQWQDSFTVSSAVYPLKGTEFWSAKAVHSENTVKFICRYRPGIKPDMRIKYGDRKFNIDGIIDVDERHKWLQIMAVEVI